MKETLFQHSSKLNHLLFNKRKLISIIIVHLFSIIAHISKHYFKLNKF